MFMSDRESSVLALVRNDPMISQEAMAQKLGISRSAVAGHIMNLTKKGTIVGRGYVLNASPFVVVVGGANVDIHGVPMHQLVDADSNIGSVLTSAGGVARNIAENLSRLGACTRLLAPIGQDRQGDFLHQHSVDAGIDMSYVLRHPNLPTSTYLSILNHQGSMQLAISDMEIMECLNPAYLKSHEPMLKQAELIIVDCNVSGDALEYLLTNFPDQAKFVDTVSTRKAMKIKPFLQGIHTLKPSLAEAQALAGITAEKHDDLPRLAAWFHEQGVERLVISLGEAGIFCSSPQGHIVQEAIKSANAVNTDGAGDSFVAGLAYAWLQKWEVTRSIGFAQAAAAVTIGSESTNHSDLSIQQVEKVYQNYYVN